MERSAANRGQILFVSFDLRTIGRKRGATYPYKRCQHEKKAAGHRCTPLPMFEDYANAISGLKERGSVSTLSVATPEKEKFYGTRTLAGCVPVGGQSRQALGPLEIFDRGDCGR